MALAYLGLGGNLGDREVNLRAAVGALREHGEVVAASSLYETAPVGYLDQPPFLNAVVALETELSARELMRAVLRSEQSLGRERTFRNAPRTVDVDLLFYDDVVSDDPDVTLPHPRLHERAFVLVPLAEIAPDLTHPLLGQSVTELLDCLGDISTEVNRVAGPEALVTIDP